MYAQWISSLNDSSSDNGTNETSIFKISDLDKAMELYENSETNPYMTAAPYDPLALLEIVAEIERTAADPNIQMDPLVRQRAQEYVVKVRNAHATLDSRTFIILVRHGILEPFFFWMATVKPKSKGKPSLRKEIHKCTDHPSNYKCIVPTRPLGT